MLSYKEIMKLITPEQITSLLTMFGSATPKKDREGNLIFQSICHNSDSWKLYYFIETQSFYCYSKCQESYNVFSLTMKIKDMDFPNAIRYVCETLNIDNTYDNTSYSSTGFAKTYIKSDWDIFDKYLAEPIATDSVKAEDKPINEDILKLYHPFYHKSWLEDNIGIEAMQLYNIKFDIAHNRIVIPHYNINNELVGIRCRNLDENAFAKYCPIDIEGKMENYTHSLSNHLYGLNHNKETIQKLGKIMLTESEKSVLMCETYFPHNNFCVACCGSNLTNAQIHLLLELNIQEVILGFDFDYEQKNDEDYLIYKKNILKKCKKLQPYFTVKILLDSEPRLLWKKASPTDGGKEILMRLMENKITITEEILENEEIINGRY